MLDWPKSFEFLFKLLGSCIHGQVPNIDGVTYNQASLRWEQCPPTREHEYVYHVGDFTSLRSWYYKATSYHIQSISPYLVFTFLLGSATFRSTLNSRNWGLGLSRCFFRNMCLLISICRDCPRIAWGNIYWSWPCICLSNLHLCNGRGKKIMSFQALWKLETNGEDIEK